MLLNRLTLTITLLDQTRNTNIYRAVHQYAPWRLRNYKKSTSEMFVYCYTSKIYNGPPLPTLLGKTLLVSATLGNNTYAKNNFAQLLEINEITVLEEESDPVNILVLGVECSEIYKQGQYYCCHYWKGRSQVIIMATINRSNLKLEEGLFYTLIGKLHIWANRMTGRIHSDLEVERVQPVDKPLAPGIQELIRLSDGRRVHPVYDSIQESLEDPYMFYPAFRKQFFSSCLEASQALNREIRHSD